MLEDAQNVVRLTAIVHELNEWSAASDAESNFHSGWRHLSRDYVISRLTTANFILGDLPLRSVAAQINRTTAVLEDEGYNPLDLFACLAELKNRLEDEAKEVVFIRLRPEVVRYYEAPKLFGEAVSNRFPQAIDDIEEAGKCLALARGTACVLHTMRILEVGLRALGKALNIPYAPSWESYLRQISDNIGKKHKNKTAKWKKEEKFYRDISGDFLTIKQAWRNPTMHVDRKYSQDEATQIFEAAKLLMQRLAQHFSAKEVEKLLR